MKTTLLSFIVISMLGFGLPSPPYLPQCWPDVHRTSSSPKGGQNTGNVLIEELPIGSKAPKIDYKMQNIFGKVATLNNIKGENGLLVIFSCNTCPYVEKSNDRYTILADLCKKKELGWWL